jgi:hypothetical protein
MKRFLVSALAVVVAACGPLSAADDFREASPSRQGIDIKLPGASGQALTSEEELGQVQQALLGQTADWYKVTRTVTVFVNGATLWVLNLCEDIIENEPTTVEKDKAIWGPHTDPLSPDTFKFTVTKVGAAYDYALEGKPKTADDSAYVKVISGHHEPGSAKNVGKGSFTVDWNAAKKLAEAHKEIGSADFTYSRNEKSDLTVSVKFKQVMDDESGQLIDADYAFAQVAGADGSFEFVVIKDLASLPNNTAAKEHFSVKSRWHNDGAGRCDVKVDGGDITTAVTLSECWGPTFLETFYEDSLGITATQGEESACVYAGADYTLLK